jgi:methylamine dehydrogenase accessory protein MauD
VSNSWFLISYVVLWGLVVCSFVLWIALLRQVGLLHARWGPRGALATEEGPELGSTLPRFVYPTLSGGELEWSAPDVLTLAVLVHPECEECEDLGPAVRTLMRDPPENVRVVALVTDSSEGAWEFARRHELDPSSVAAAPDALQLLRIENTPMALVLDPEARVLGKGIANSLEQLEVHVVSAREEAAAEEPAAARELELVRADQTGSETI